MNYCRLLTITANECALSQKYVVSLFLSLNWHYIYHHNMGISQGSIGAWPLTWTSPIGLLLHVLWLDPCNSKNRFWLGHSQECLQILATTLKTLYNTTIYCIFLLIMMGVFADNLTIIRGTLVRWNIESWILSDISRSTAFCKWGAATPAKGNFIWHCLSKALTCKNWDLLAGALADHK